MSEQLYVLMAVGWDYNDEYYFKTDGGHPEKVFVSKELAEKEADRLNLKEFKELFSSGTLIEYCNDFSGGISNYEKADVIISTLFGMDLDTWCDHLYDYQRAPKFVVEPTEEQWVELMKCSNLNFWEVVSVEKG